jgi:hypothetical protein
VALKLNADNPVVRHYDKLIVVAVLIGLLVSLFYLTRAAGPARAREEEKYKQQIQSLKPTSANLTAVDLADYQAAERQARSPLQLEPPNSQQAGFLVPETRVICVVKACKKLIPYEAEVCPFCGGQQPVPKDRDPSLDSDGDGIPDKVEIQWGLNPNDSSDAKGDLDGDGFSNLEEYLAKTDPRDPKSHPALVNLLRVKELRSKKLPLLFIGKNTMPGGKTQFQIKDLSKQQTFYLYEGDKIGDSGFVAGAFTPKVMERDLGGNKVKVDVSAVVLKRLSDNKEVTLIINDNNVKETDVEAVVVLPLDNTEHTVLEGGTLKVRDEAYRVLSVDSAKTTVTIENEATGQQKVIPKLD